MHVGAAASFYAAEVLADTPVGYWRLDDASGTTATAVTGTDGQYEGDVALPGVAGVTRDGDIAFTTVSAPTSGVDGVSMARPVQDDLSVEFWFEATSGSGGSNQWWEASALVDDDQLGAADDFGVSLSADGRVVAGVGSSGYDVSVRSGPGLTDGAWHYVVLTRAELTGALELWVDGAQVDAATGGTGALIGNPTVTLGRYASNYGPPFTGTLDEVAMYGAVLSPAAMAAHRAAVSGASYAATITADAPAAYWRLGETAGTTATATVGSAGSYDPGPKRVAGVTGDGDGAQRFRRPASVRLPRTVSGSFSLECWFRASLAHSAGLDFWQGDALLGADVNGGGRDFGVSLNADGRVLGGTGDPDVTAYSAPGFADGAWHHVVFTRDGASGAMILYVDGTQRATATGTTQTLDGPAEIDVGREPVGTKRLAGDVDDVAVYDTVLPADRVLAHYRRGGS